MPSFNDFVHPDGRIDQIGFTAAFGGDACAECMRGFHDAIGWKVPCCAEFYANSYTFGYVQGAKRWDWINQQAKKD